MRGERGVSFYSGMIHLIHILTWDMVGVPSYSRLGDGEGGGSYP